MIDTHVHVYHAHFDADREEAIQRAFDAGVTRMLLPAIDVDSIHRALDLCARHDGLYAMSALHPSETRDAEDRTFDEVVRLCDEPGVVAVGETGLDYYWDRSFDDAQQDFLRRHIRLAVEKDLPLVLHNRNAGEDLVRIISEERAQLDEPEKLRGVFHCFGGPPELVADIDELGFYYGIGGTLTFKNSGVADIVRHIPLERILLETDAPFLAPVPMRGKRNEPSYLPHVCRRLAEVKGVDEWEVVAITSAGAEALFRL